MIQTSTLWIVAKLLGETVDDLGYSSKQLFESAGIDINDYIDEYSRLNNELMDKLWLTAENITGDSFIGFKVGERIQPAMLKSLGFSWLASRTLFDGIKRFVQFSEFVSGCIHVTVSVTNNAVRLTEYREQINSPKHPYAMGQFIYALIFKMCRLTANEQICPMQISFPESPIKLNQDSISDLESFFQCKVMQQQAEPYVEFDRAVLTQPLNSWSRELTDINDAMLKNYLDNCPDRFSKQVILLVTEQISSGNLNLKTIAHNLHMSVKTIQRKLAEEGESFSSIVDNTKLELAKNYLLSHRFSIKQTAFLLSYSDVASFSKAFKRWTGDTPGNFTSASHFKNTVQYCSRS